MKRYLPIVIILVAVFAQCKKQDKTPEKHLTCKVDGKFWEYSCKGQGLFAECYWARLYGNRKFDLYGSNGASQVSISVRDENGIVGNYAYILNTTGQNLGWYSNYSKSTIQYSTDSVRVGTITIQFNSDSSFVSGKFNFNAKYLYSDESVNITEGDFYLPLERLP